MLVIFRRSRPWFRKGLATAILLLFASVFGCLTWSPASLAQQNDVQDAPDADFYVELSTTRGPIILKVFYTIVPYTAGHFLDLVQKHVYDGLPFHRVLWWVVQSGDTKGDGNGCYLDPETGDPVYIKLETSPRLRHSIPGMVAMARGPNINSASSQFYITKKAMPSLDGKYAVFGQVVRGIEHVFEINQGDKILRARILGPEQQAEQTPAPVPVQSTPEEQPADQPIGDPGF